jgi:ribosome recycling factor
MLDDIKKDATDRMGKCVNAFKTELKRLRTGRASTTLVDHIRVDYYGAESPLNQVANVAVEDARTITIIPYDKQMVSVVEKALMKSDLGITPSTAGNVIRVPLPPLTEERRKDLVRVVHKRMEEARVEIRNLRREAADQLKKEERDGQVGADEGHRQLEALQKTTDRHVAEVDRLGGVKEQEVLEV